MKRFKIVDFWISTSLIVFFLLIDFIGSSYNSIFNDYFFTGYFIVGGWQVISMLVHTYNHWFTIPKGSRYIYHCITFVALITMPVGSLWVLLFAAPFMAIYYTWICYEETYIKMRRPLDLLK